jgi:hypothetical protein
VKKSIFISQAVTINFVFTGKNIARLKTQGLTDGFYSTKQLKIILLLPKADKLLGIYPTAHMNIP